MNRQGKAQVRWWHSQRAKALWKTMRRLSVLQLVPLSLIFYVRGCSENERQERYPGAFVSSALFAPDGSALFGGGSFQLDHKQHGLLYAWDTASGKLCWQRTMSGYVEVHDITRNGNYTLVSSGPSGSARNQFSILDAETGSTRYDFPRLPGESLSASFAPNGSSAILVTSRCVECWDFGTRPVRRWLQKATQSENETPPLLTRHNLLLVVRDPYNIGQSMTVELWNLRDGKKRQTLMEGKHLFTTVTADEESILVGATGYATGLSLYNLASGKSVSTRPFGSSTDVTGVRLPIIRDGKVYATVFYRDHRNYKEQSARLVWNLRTGKAKMIYERGPASDIKDAIISFDRQTRAILNRGNGKQHPPLVTLHDIATGQVARDLEGEAGWRPAP